MTPDQFWGSTLAQLEALIPDQPGEDAEEGTADDLKALASMAGGW